MNLRGQSTVEPMLVLTGALLAIVLASYIRMDLFEALVAHIADWVGTQVELP